MFQKNRYFCLSFKAGRRRRLNDFVAISKILFGVSKSEGGFYAFAAFLFFIKFSYI